MNHELLIAVLAGLGGMIGWGLADLFAKKTIDTIGDMASLVWGHVFGTGILFVIWVTQGSHTGSLPANTWTGFILFGAAQALVYLFLYKGFSKGQVAVLNPVFASFSGITALLSIVFFHEAVHGAMIGALVIIFVGIVLLSLDIGALRTRRFDFSHAPGIGEVGIATVIAGVWTLLWSRFVGGNNWVFYALCMYACMTLVIVIIAQAQRTSLVVMQKTTWALLFLIGLCEIAAYLAVSWGYSASDRTSVTALLSGAFSLPTMLLARVFLKEKTTRTQVLGGIVVVTGLVVLSAL